MLPSPAIASLALLLVLISAPTLADQLDRREEVLDLQLDGLESRVLQRQTRAPRTSDLQIDQDQRIAEQRLRTLKTRTPRNARLPLYERQIDRIRRPGRNRTRSSRTRTR